MRYELNSNLSSSILATKYGYAYSDSSSGGLTATSTSYTATKKCYAIASGTGVSCNVGTASLKIFVNSSQSTSASLTDDGSQCCSGSTGVIELESGDTVYSTLYAYHNPYNSATIQSMSVILTIFD